MGKKIYVSGPRKNAIYKGTKPSPATRRTCGAFILNKLLLKLFKHKFYQLYLFNKH